MRDKKSNPEPLHQASQPDYSPEDPEFWASEMPADEELKDLLGQWQTPNSFDALDQRVLTAYRQRSRPSLWRRLLTASIRVPAPVMAAAMLLMLFSAAVALRALSHEPQLVLQSAPPVERIKIVEMPVGAGKVITRTVYVERKTRPKSGRQINLSSRDANGLSLAVYEGKEATGYFTHGDLSGFQPAEEMNFKVIKKEVKLNEQ